MNIFMGKIRIIFIVPTMDYKNGWGRYSSELIKRIVARPEIEAVILSEQPSGYPGEIPILRRSWKIFGSALRVRKYLRTADIVHAFDGYPYGIIAYLANLGIGKKIIINGVGTYSVAPFYNFRTSALLKAAFKKADAVISISSYTKKEIEKKVVPKNHFVIPMGVDCKKFNLPHSGAGDYILSVGAVTPRKGYDISIQAFAKVKEKFPNLKYYIVGSQRETIFLDEIKKLIRKLDLERDVKFFNYVGDEELANLYREAKLFILSSVNFEHFFEGFGLVFMEAAASGLPVVGTRGCGIEDSVKEVYN